MTALVVLVAVAVLLAMWLVAGWRLIGGDGACEHLDPIREETWRW